MAKNLKRLVRMYKKARREADEFRQIFRKTYPQLNIEERRHINCVYSYYMWKRREKQARELLRKIKSLRN